MEQPSSTENQLPMAPVYDNMANLCLLCANTQNPEDQPFIDIHGQLGMQLKILARIQKFLTITIEAGFPLQVCVACVGKLNVCHELVQSTEKAHEKLKSLRDEWETDPLTDAQDDPLDDVDNPWSLMNDNVPSPEAAVESQDLETEQQPKMGHKKKSTEKKKTAEENQLEEFSMLQQPSLLVKGSQIAFVFTGEDALNKDQIMVLAVINLDADCANSKEKVTEKVSRIVQHTKKRLASKEAQCEENDTSASNQLLYSCENCQCSFFLQEEMVSHFESLHPEQVFLCTACDEKVCGTREKGQKHLQLHQALDHRDQSQTDELLFTLQVPSRRNNMFEPEFVIVPLGYYPPHLSKKSVQCLQSRYITVIQRNQWIKPDMKIQISMSLEMVISKILLCKVVEKQNPMVECDVCGKKLHKYSLVVHMKKVHNPEKIRCCHCNFKLMIRDESTHIEFHHNGGKNLVCNICDSKFNENGEIQPHMIPKSDFPFPCSVKTCRKTYQTEANLEYHKRTAHISYTDTSQCLCQLCGKVYKDKNVLRYHLKYVHFPNLSTYTCELCGAIFSRKQNLNHHKHVVHGPKLPCHVCGKMLTRPKLRLHLKIHEGAKFPCKYCGKLYTTSNCRLVHEQTIHKGNQMRCRICKDLSFKSVKGMEEHRLKHERGEEIILPRYMQPVQCSICSKTLRNSIRLNHHMRIHKKAAKKVNTIDIFPCVPCLLRFMTQESYDRHVETHHPDGVPNSSSNPKASEFHYQCRYCEKIFKYKRSCKDHESSLHH